MPDVWMTVAQVAEHMQVSDEQVRRWIRRRDLQAVDVGSNRKSVYRVSEAQLTQFLKGRTT